MDEGLVLGSCCICLKEDETVGNMIGLHFEAPVPGTGWGCSKCGKPSDGALTVVCDQCLEDHQDKIDTAVKHVIKGWPGKKKRVAIKDVDQKKRFEHDMSLHADEVAHLN